MDVLPAWIPASDPFDLTALIAGLLSVVLLIRQSIWTWPVGIVYVLCASVVFFRHGLYFSLGLHGIFLALNVYGWLAWHRGESEDALKVSRSSLHWLTALALGALLAAGVLGELMATYTDAAYAHLDAAGSALSCAALWLSARKKIESWAFWLVIDLLYAWLYYVSAAPFLALLYLVYVPLAISGYLAWRRSMPASVEERA